MEKKKVRDILQELKVQREMSIMDVDKDTLIDIKDVTVNTDLPEEERVLDYISQIKNPYLYKDNGVVVKIEFSGEKKLEDCVTDYLRSLPRGR